MGVFGVVLFRVVKAGGDTKKTHVCLLGAYVLACLDEDTFV
jgi:hypothetical protein